MTVAGLLAGFGASGLYAFTTATFTSGGVTGRTGPTLAQAITGLTGPETATWENNTAFFSASGYSLSQYLIDKLVINSSTTILQRLIITFPAILCPGAVRQVFSYCACTPRAPPVG